MFNTEEKWNKNKSEKQSWNWKKTSYILKWFLQVSVIVYVFIAKIINKIIEDKVR